MLFAYEQCKKVRNNSRKENATQLIKRVKTYAGLNNLTYFYNTMLHELFYITDVKLQHRDTGQDAIQVSLYGLDAPGLYFQLLSELAHSLDRLIKVLNIHVQHIILPLFSDP
jgi:hypothetical protein